MQLFHLIKLIIPQYHLIWLLSCLFFFFSDQNPNKGYTLHLMIVPLIIYIIIFPPFKKNHIDLLKKPGYSYVLWNLPPSGFGRWGPHGIVFPSSLHPMFPVTWWLAPVSSHIQVRWFWPGLFTGGTMFSGARTGQWTWVEAVLSLQDPTSWL